MAFSDQSDHRYMRFSDEEPYRRFIQQEHQQNAGNAIPIQQITNGDRTHGPYGGLLFHPKWKEKRAEILARDLHRCVVCQSGEELQVHHRQYHFRIKDNQFCLPWDYEDGLLITLCKSCHTRGHNKYKVPTINI